MSIKNWKEDDRPREKFLTKGKNAVSDAELIAILIGMGNKNDSALDIAQNILSTYDNSIQKIAHLSIKDLMKFKGIGEAKAITIAAALELGNRKQAEPAREIKKIATSFDSFQLLKEKFTGLKQEEFYILILNKSLKPIHMQQISIGRTDATLVDIKIIAKTCLEHLASAIIVAHNHPSGNLNPSKEDLDLTERLKEGLKLLEIKLVDHLIIFENKYYSFADEEKI